MANERLCPKISMILHKDMPGWQGWQYAEALRAVCANCNERRPRAYEMCERLRIAFTYLEAAQTLATEDEAVHIRVAMQAVTRVLRELGTPPPPTQPKEV